MRLLCVGSEMKALTSSWIWQSRGFKSDWNGPVRQLSNDLRQVYVFANRKRCVSRVADVEAARMSRNARFDEMLEVEGDEIPNGLKGAVSWEVEVVDSYAGGHLRRVVGDMVCIFGIPGCSIDINVIEASMLREKISSGKCPLL